LQEAQSLVYIRVQKAAYIEIADNTFVHLHGLSLNWHLTKRMGNLVRSMDRGIQAAQQTMKYVFLNLFPTLAEGVAVSLVFVFHYRNGRLAVFVGLNLYLYCYATVKITVWRKRFRSAQAKHDNDMHDRLTDSLVNYETIKYFTAEEYEQREYRRALEKFMQYSMNTEASMRLLNIVQNLIVNFTLAGGLILAAAQVLEEQGDLGNFVAVIAYISNVFAPLSYLGTIYNAVVTGLADMHSFGEILAETPEVQDNPRAFAVDLSIKVCTPIIEFQQVCFIPRSVRDVSFKVDRGKSLALVGPSGSGKTTIT